MDNFAVNFTAGLALVMALIALCLSFFAYRHVKNIFLFLKSQKTRTVVVNNEKNTVTIIKEVV